ncbi:hypothetical protein ASE66_25535 [Bosea sp. Root483D1]|uniref:hypothetical protein n=1 Tax=Bosea sp. Root483D1 TaxID=1736544 RepID=UPI00070F8232|nr:hypothetical protein [Bosea sp. Root483D1]KRE22556.1 hypothetical protein ASE66_25535 [Bosea sp. Root483D1]
MTVTYYQAPANPNDAAGRRAILSRIDAANDNQPTRVEESEIPRHAKHEPELRPLLVWRRLRIAEGKTEAPSTWMLAAGASSDLPQVAEASVENLWPVATLIRAAQDGVDYCERSGAIIPYGGKSGALEYSEGTGRLVRLGRLVLADDLRPESANDDEPEDEAGDVLAVDEVFGRAISGDRWGRGNVSTDRRYNTKIARAGSIIGIRHKTEKGKWVTLTTPRNPDGAYRKRSTEQPEPIFPDDSANAQERLASLLAVLSPQTLLVLDAALEAQNFREIGELLGKTGKHAERVGKQALIDSCTDLQAGLVSAQQRLAA